MFKVHSCLFRIFGVKQWQSHRVHTGSHLEGDRNTNSTPVWHTFKKSCILNVRKNLKQERLETDIDLCESSAITTQDADCKLTDIYQTHRFVILSVLGIYLITSIVHLKQCLWLNRRKWPEMNNAITKSSMKMNTEFWVFYFCWRSGSWGSALELGKCSIHDCWLKT